MRKSCLRGPKRAFCEKNRNFMFHISAKSSIFFNGGLVIEGFAMLYSIRQFWKKQETLEKKFFWMLLCVFFLCALLSSIANYVEQVGSVTTIICVCGCVFCAIVGFFAYKTSMYSVGYFCIVLLFSGLVFPTLFLMCGGIQSGMPLFLLSGAFISAFIANKKLKFVALFISLAGCFVPIGLMWRYPQFVHQPMSLSVMYFDIIASFATVGIGIFAVCNYAFCVYKLEWGKREKLLAELDHLSKCDSQTGLYNRGYFVQNFENMDWRQKEKTYVALFCIDRFRDVNDIHGHVFGDKVICRVADVLKGIANESLGELAVKYGGESFVYMMHAESEVEAYTKADKVREMVSMLDWTEKPGFNVTVSGGFIACSGSDPLNPVSLLRKVDELLYESRPSAPNQIRSKVS